MSPVATQSLKPFVILGSAISILSDIALPIENHQGREA